MAESVIERIEIELPREPARLPLKDWNAADQSSSGSSHTIMRDVKRTFVKGSNNRTTGFVIGNASVS
ncbi:hypothetical protein [Roseitranquillus sediminis]|uniref:hypothetical protein n=1 Tax=Roseitranquillus sediminis TaxID=2809051 RepID=UPI001D0C066E|nr:hypothetical protein [Roseitranquillus sediminis]MBM9595993.1 hypothetical protein [Roseitranquillus sediminis]